MNKLRNERRTNEKWVNQRLSDPMNEWMNDSVSERMYERMKEFII